MRNNNSRIECRDVMRDIIWFYNEGYSLSGGGFGVFSRAFDELKLYLRENYFEKYRKRHGRLVRESELLWPRTGNFISIGRRVLFSELNEQGGIEFNVKRRDGIEGNNFFLDVLQYEKFPFSVDVESVDDPRDLIGRSLESLKSFGYGYLVRV